MGGILGKGGSEQQQQPAPVQDTGVGDAMYEMMYMMDSFTAQMSDMMAAQSESNNNMLQNMMQQQQTSSLTTPITTQEVDWTEKNAELANKMSANYDLEAARRKGVQDTILTSPILDEEDEPNLTGSVLTGA